MLFIHDGKYVEKITETLTLTVRMSKALQSADNYFRHMKDVSILIENLFSREKSAR